MAHPRAGTWAAAGVIGVLLITALGSALHFLYAASCANDATAWLGATNESVWEHMKLLLWPWVVVTFGLWAWLEGRENSAHGHAHHTHWWAGTLFLGAALGLLIAMAFIPAAFYGYTAVSGLDHNLVADIGIFVAAATLGMYAALVVTDRAKPAVWKAALGGFLLASTAAVFVVFSYYPPDDCVLFTTDAQGTLPAWCTV